MERFKGISPHRPLDEGATKIRIVNLLPGEFGDPIECILEHIDMEDTKDYEAISYCWGESSITKPILLESKPYPVTTNLFDGLQRLRRSDGPRKLWIDSLCINQSDVAERSREIQKMWSIYKSSAGVVVWLGESLPWSETTVQAIADFIIDIGQAWNPERLDHSGVVARYGCNELWRQHQRMNEFLRQRQWFERTWVIQEIAAKSPFNNSELCPTMLCGTVRLSFPYLQRANAFWTTMPSEYDSLTILRIYNPLYIQLEMCGEYVMVQLNSFVSISSQLELYLANGSAFLRTTDPRDQIYGILGLLQHGSLPARLTPDYGKPLQQVLVEYAKYFLEENGCIDVIQFNSGNTPNLPSWVPDWRHKPGRTHLREKQNTPMDFRIKDGQWCLEIDFVPLSVIDEIKPDQDQDIKPDNSLQFAKDYIISASEWLYNKSPEDHHVPLHDIQFLMKKLILCYDYFMGHKFTRLWHQLIIDAGPSPAIGDEHVFQGKKGLQRSYPSELNSIDGPDLKAGIAEVWGSVAETIRDRSIFVCTSGSVGIMEQMNVQPQHGDVIGCVRGASCEFVLRPYTQDGYYRAIGQCHRSLRGGPSNNMDVTIDGLDGRGFDRLHSAFAENSCRKVILC